MTAPRTDAPDASQPAQQDSLFGPDGNALVPAEALIDLWRIRWGHEWVPDDRLDDSLWYCLATYLWYTAKVLEKHCTDKYLQDYSFRLKEDDGNY